MNEPGGALGPRSPHPRILAAAGAAGATLILGAGGVYFLTQASSEVLAATWWAVITLSLVGVMTMIYVVAARSSLPGASNGRGDDRPATSGPGSAPLMDDIDAELFRILSDARLGDISTRRAHGRARRTGAG